MTHVAHVAWMHRATDQPTGGREATELTDGQLVGQVCAGRPEVYAELVRRYQTSVYQVALRLCGEREEALDIAQDAFVRAYDALGRFDRAQSFGPWICRIATNVALSRLERRRLPVVPLEQGPSGELVSQTVAQQHAETSEPERLYLADEQRARISQALLALPPHYRAVIELRHFQDRRYDEIATTLGLPLSDVKSHLFRARRRLRELLQEAP